MRYFFLALVSIFLTLPLSICAQTKGSLSNHQFDYSKGIWAGTKYIRMFKDDPRTATFSLITSWIPGHENKGYFRYQLNVTINPLSAIDEESAKVAPPQGWGVPAALDRIDLCVISLHLFDSSGFILEKIPVSFMRGVDQNSNLIGLKANDSYQMGLQEYKSLLASSAMNLDGAWSVTWACPQ